MGMHPIRHKPKPRTDSTLYVGKNNITKIDIKKGVVVSGCSRKLLQNIFSKKNVTEL